MAEHPNLFRDRVRARLSTLGINAYEAARRATPPLPRSFVEDILTEKKLSVRGPNLLKLAAALECDAGYLLGSLQTPARPPLVSSFDPDEPEDAPPSFDEPQGSATPRPFADAIPQAAARMGGGSLGAPAILSKFDDVTVTFAEDEVAEWWRVPPSILRAAAGGTNPKTTVMFPMTGDSMEPTVLRTDFVMVDLSRRALEPEGIWAVDYGQGLTMKRLRLTRTETGPRVVISSDNKTYPEQDFAPDELTIVGRFVGRFTFY